MFRQVYSAGDANYDDEFKNIICVDILILIVDTAIVCNATKIRAKYITMC